MTITIRILAALGCAALAAPAAADVSCMLTGFRVQTYDTGGAFLAGTMGGQYKTGLIICGVTGGNTDCASPTTDRRTAVALTALGLGRPLTLYFANAASCAAVTPGTVVTDVMLEP